MTRTTFLRRLPLLLAAPSILAACRTNEPSTAGMTTAARSSTTGGMGIPPPDTSIARLAKPKDEWRRLLEPDRYAVLFEEATEPPRSSPLNDEHRAGTFVCAACHLPLFASATKFESGTGWPSFFDVLPGRVGTTTDTYLGYPRTEYHCVRCGGHQGHVFEDGPRPTGLRYCNNGLALLFFPDGAALPALRA